MVCLMRFCMTMILGSLQTSGGTCGIPWVLGLCLALPTILRQMGKQKGHIAPQSRLSGVCWLSVVYHLKLGVKWLGPWNIEYCCIRQHWEAICFSGTRGDATVACGLDCGYRLACGGPECSHAGKVHRGRSTEAAGEGTRVPEKVL